MRGAIMAGLVVVAGSLVWVVGGRDHERSVEETVRAFFEARVAGDCGRLAELFSEASRSDGGRIGLDEFQDQCADVVGDYQPDLGDVEVVSEDDDEAAVNVSVHDEPELLPGRQEGVLVRGDGEGSLAYEIGRLVREGGEWAVEADHSFFRVGRSVEETVRGFVDAYNNSDCEGQIDYQSERVSSDGGRLSGGESLDQCVEAAEGRQALPDQASAVVEPVEVEVSYDPDDPGTATAQWGAPLGPERPSESVTLVKEGLEWKLDATLEAVQEIRLAARLIVDGQLPGFRLTRLERVSRGSGSPDFFDIDEGDDAVERRREAGFERGAFARFSPDDDSTTSTSLALYEFDDDDGARVYADLLANRIGQGADSISPAPVPSVTEVRGAVTYCAFPEDACQHAIAASGVAVSGRLLVVVEVVDDRSPPTAELIGQVEEVLHAQLDRLRSGS